MISQSSRSFFVKLLQTFVTSNVITYAYIYRAFLVTCYLVVCMCILYNFFVVLTHIFFYEEGSKEMLETLAYLFFQSDVCVCRKQDTGVSNIKIFTEKLDSQFRPIHVCMCAICHLHTAYSQDSNNSIYVH